MIHITPPANYTAYPGMTSVFLAGSIEMGVAVDWQAEVVAALKDQDILILNPRRNDWNAGWEQSIDNPQFREQVEWELGALEKADIVLFYFAPDTKAPITLLELGLYAATKPKKLIVCCPKGYWRKGNVDIVCAKYGVKQVATLQKMIQFISR